MNWVALVLISAILVAIGNIMRKHVLKHEHPLEQLAAEAPFRFLFVLPLAFLIQTPEPKMMLLIAGAALLLTTTLVYRNRAYRHLPISTVSPLMNFSPIILLILSYVLLQEKPAAIQIGGIVLVVLGGYILDLNKRDWLGPLKRAGKQKYTWLLLAIFVLLSCMALVDKALLSMNADFISYTFWLYLWSSGFFMLADLTLYGGKGLVNDWKKGWKWLAMISIFGITNILFFYGAISQAGVLISLAVPLRRTSTIIETIIGGSLFHEANIWRKVLAAVIMVAGVAFIV